MESGKHIITGLMWIGIPFGFLMTITTLPKIHNALRIIKSGFYLGLYKHKFKYFGKNSKIFKMEAYLNLDKISIGSESTIEKGALLRCYSIDGTIGEINIGNNVNIGLNVNISSCKKITICDGVLLGRNVMINDNSHGNTNSRADLMDNPVTRPLVSKGSIKIEENVWIGENAIILSGITIGHNSIIGANSVVTKNVPPFSIVGGIPAKILKQYEAI